MPKEQKLQVYALILHNWKVPPGPYIASLLISDMSGNQGENTRHYTDDDSIDFSNDIEEEEE
eukprot:8752168-Ditylum_brightwellii.AAC.1